jgi:uncharacterized protein (DUF58 family)
LPDPADQEKGFSQITVSWGLSAHARRLLTLALAGLVIAAATGRPEFAGLAAPAVLLLASWRIDRPASVWVRASLTDPLLAENLGSTARAEIRGQGDFDAELVIEPADSVTAGQPVTIPAGSPTRPVYLPFTPVRWGSRPVGMLSVTLRDRHRLTEGKALLHLPFVNCRPQPAQMRRSVVLSRLPSRLGEHVARVAGDGAEFAGVREFVPGDRQRRINWPATTRLGVLHLSTFAAERTQNVVIIADETTDVGDPGSSSLDLVLRGAAGAMWHYLADHDRVGLIIYAGILKWIGPGQGQRHFQRLIDLLVSSPGGWERASGLDRLPRAGLPPGALVLIFSPLLDPRLVEAIRDLRERGFSVIVIDVLNAEPHHEGKRISAMTARLWLLEQQAVRFSLTQLGVPVVHWDGISSLDEPLARYTGRVMVVHR